MTNGLRVSQAGIDVNRAADYQKTMDERWPVVDHIFMGIVDIQALRTDSPGVLNNSFGTIAHIPVFRHGLGFLPAFRVKMISYSTSNISSTIRNSSFFADDQFIYIEMFKSSGVSITNFKFFLSVISRDCTLEYQAPIDIITARQQTRPSEYGLKVLQPGGGFNIDDKNKSRFVFNTNGKSMQIQQTGMRSAGPTSVPTYTLSIDHRLGYPPTYYLAKVYTHSGSANPSASKRVIEALGPGTGVATSDGVRMNVVGAQAALTGDFMFIILKDPVDTAR